ncbi:MAG: hypothetical protein V1934_02715 [Methanobacteriota archaeon]
MNAASLPPTVPPLLGRKGMNLLVVSMEKALSMLGASRKAIPMAAKSDSGSIRYSRCLSGKRMSLPTASATAIESPTAANHPTISEPLSSMAVLLNPTAPKARMAKTGTE